MAEYMFAKITVKYGRMAEFVKIIEGQVIPLVKRNTEWTQVGCFREVVGDFHEVLHIWQMKDANAVAAGFARVAQDPEFDVIQASLIDVVIGERFDLVQKTPYSV